MGLLCGAVGGRAELGKWIQIAFRVKIKVINLDISVVVCGVQCAVIWCSTVRHEVACCLSVDPLLQCLNGATGNSCTGTVVQGETAVQFCSVMFSSV